MTISPPNGSTIPLRLPKRNDFIRLLPSARMGIDMIAPSGMFCIAIPSDMARAAAAVIPAPLCMAPASTTPTAMPSGRLCMVTASESIAVRDR